MRVVHIPVYHDNAYQRLLMEAQRKLGVETIEGGGGGYFFRTAARRWKADILHFHWLHPYLIRQSAIGTVLSSVRFLLEVCVLKLLGQRVVWTIHNLKNHDNRHVRLERWFSKRFARSVSAFIAHSKAGASKAAITFGIRNTGRIHVIPQGNYIGCYPNQISTASARRELGLPPHSTVFLFLGRVEPYKRVPELVRAFKAIPSESWLVIAGRLRDADLENEIRTEIGVARQIVFHPGFVPDERVQVYMNACDAVVLPYREILNSSAAVLAMSFGRACVAPRLPELEEVVAEDGGFFYDSKEANGIADAIRAAMASRDRLGEIGRRNLTKIAAHNWNDVASRMMAIYGGIMARP